MTKVDFVARLAEDLGESKAKTERILDTILNGVQMVLANGQDLTLHGFGKFEVVTRAAREGRNPQTGKPVAIPAKKKVKFTAQKALREAVA